MKQANAVCRDAAKQVAAVPIPKGDDVEALPKTAATIVALERKALGRLQAIHPPKADRAEIAKWIALVDQTIDQAETSAQSQQDGDLQRAVTANTNGAELDQRADDLARGYGLRLCVHAAAPPDPTRRPPRRRGVKRSNGGPDGRRSPGTMPVMPRYDRLSALDSSFLHLERLETPMHVGAVSIFEGAPFFDDSGRFRLAETRRLVGSRLHLIPRFRKRIMHVPFEQGRPVWVDDARFDIAYHVRLTALPAPGSREQLLALTARIQAQLLDRTRPLWELWFVEGSKAATSG